MDIATSTARRSLREPLSALALFAGGLAWIAAFWFPAFYTSQGAVEGYWVFATGWMGFAIFQFAWYANLLMLLGIGLMYTSPLWGATFAGVGVLVATQAFWFSSIPTGEVDMPILQVGQGFWFWYGSIILLGIGVFLGSEQLEAEKNQSINNQQAVIPELKLQKIPTPEPSTAVSSALVPVALTQAKAEELTVETQTVTNAPATPSRPSVVSVVEDHPAIEPEPELSSLPFARVPEPDLPNFAELTAANEQDYFQLANEQALKPVYTEHLAEDWPPNMSLVVSPDPDPFKTEPQLAASLDTNPANSKLDSLAEVEQPLVAARSAERQPSTAAFFDPWKV